VPGPSPSSHRAQITTSNEYGPSTYGKEYPWLADKAVVEPHKYTTLTIGYNTNTYGNKLSFKWKVTEPGADGSTTSLAGSTVTNTFTKLGGHDIEVTVFDEDGKKVRG